MLNQFIKGKVYVFIDAANIFYTQKTLGWRIGYEQLRKCFQEECGENLGKMFVYTAYDSERPQQKKFLDMLEINGYIPRTKDKNKKIIVMSTRGHISKELLERAKFVDLRKIKEEIKQ